jgi:hypothetical protein
MRNAPALRDGEASLFSNAAGITLSNRHIRHMADFCGNKFAQIRHA